LSQNVAPAVGQVSTDGQFRWDGVQWVPIPRSAREPTSWTRPMQLAAAALLAVEAIVTVVADVLFYNHDAVKSALEAQGTQIPANTTEDQLIGITIGFAIALAVFFGLIEIFGAVAAFLGWKWAFWYVLVLMGLGSIAALFGVYGLARASSSPLPLGVIIFEELLAVAAIPLFIWMLIGVITRGPWAMKRPGT
jgi:hypothetical protein